MTRMQVPTGRAQPRLGQWLAPWVICACLGPAGVSADTPIHAAPVADAMARRLDAVAQTVIGILGYARWPGGDAAAVRLCVLGQTRYAGHLLGGQVPRLGSRPVQVSHRSLDDPGVPADCDAVYLGAMGAKEQQALLGRVRGHAVLPISEAGGECVVGPAFCLQVSGHAVTFEVNLDALARSGVRVHPAVLKLGSNRETKP